MGNWVSQLLKNNHNATEYLLECLKSYLSSVILGPLGSDFHYYNICSWVHSGLIFGISETEDKGHTFGQKPYVTHIYSCLRTYGLQKNKTKAAVFEQHDST